MSSRIQKQRQWSRWQNQSITEYTYAKYGWRYQGLHQFAKIQQRRVCHLVLEWSSTKGIYFLDTIIRASWGKRNRAIQLRTDSSKIHKQKESVCTLSLTYEAPLPYLKIQAMKTSLNSSLDFSLRLLSRTKTFMPPSRSTRWIHLLLPRALFSLVRWSLRSSMQFGRSHVYRVFGDDIHYHVCVAQEQKIKQELSLCSKS